MTNTYWECFTVCQAAVWELENTAERQAEKGLFWQSYPSSYNCDNVRNLARVDMSIDKESPWNISCFCNDKNCEPILAFSHGVWRQPWNTSWPWEAIASWSELVLEVGLFANQPFPWCRCDNLVCGKHGTLNSGEGRMIWFVVRSQQEIKWKKPKLEDPYLKPHTKIK